MLVAGTKGLPVRAIAPAASVGTTPETEDFTAIMVRPESPINGVEDLKGQTTVQSMVDTFVSASLDAKGVDSSSVKFIEIPFPDQVAAEAVRGSSGHSSVLWSTPTPTPTRFARSYRGSPGVDPKVAERIALPLWEPEINRETTERLADLLVKYKLLERRPNVAEIVATTN